MDMETLFNTFIKTGRFIKFKNNVQCTFCKSCDFFSCIQYDQDFLCLRCCEYIVMTKNLQNVSNCHTIYCSLNPDISNKELMNIVNYGVLFNRERILWCDKCGKEIKTSINYKGYDLCFSCTDNHSRLLLFVGKELDKQDINDDRNDYRMLVSPHDTNFIEVMMQAFDKNEISLEDQNLASYQVIKQYDNIRKRKKISKIISKSLILATIGVVLYYFKK
jgi:hypothetical protein